MRSRCVRQKSEVAAFARLKNLIMNRSEGFVTPACSLLDVGRRVAEGHEKNQLRRISVSA